MSSLRVLTVCSTIKSVMDKLSKFDRCWRSQCSYETVIKIYNPNRQLIINTKQNISYYQKELDGVDLTELREILYVIATVAPNDVGSYGGTLDHVKNVIEYIEKEIKAEEAIRS